MSLDKYVEAKLEDDASKEGGKRTCGLNRILNYDNSSWNLQKKSMSSLTVPSDPGGLRVVQIIPDPMKTSALR